MNRTLFISFIFFSLFLQMAKCLVCTSNFCDKVRCQKVEECYGPDHIVKKGGFCGCCDTCYTILGEGESCRYCTPPGVPPLPIKCGEGLGCYDGICVKGAKKCD